MRTVEKKCSRCGRSKPLYKFRVRSRKTAKGRVSFIDCWCNRCNNEVRRRTDWKWAEHNKAHKEQYVTPAKRRKKKLRAKYGITEGDYVHMLIEQGGRCAICGRPAKRDRVLSVDHNHTTGKVRGLLCNTCNVALGLFYDSTDNLRNAADYLNNSH